MFDENMFLEEIKKYEDIIIYGYKDIGTCILDYIIFQCTDIKTSNYGGKVKYFAISGKLSFDYEKKGIPVRQIDELTGYSEDALVIVATQEKHHDDITKRLDELNFKNRFYIKYEMYNQIKEKVNVHRELTDNKVRQYGLMHEMKLERVRKKVKDGKKVKVFFMTQRAAAFGAASVYKAMEKSDIFDPYIFCISKRDVFYQNFYEDVMDDVNFFKNRNYKVICAYDENKQAKDLTMLEPDIIFWDSPNLYGPANNSHFRLDHINWKYLTCYIPYGLLMIDSFYYHYDNINIRNCWKYFLDTDSSYERALYQAEFNGYNIVKAGYPKFDDYIKTDKSLLPKKLLNGNKTVIYAPHWSLFIENNLATFDLYKDIIMDCVKNNPNINFVFKPHPELGFRITATYKNGLSDYSFEEYQKYVAEWNNLPNGVVVNQGDYFDVFLQSDCMITDCGSFIGEYLPSLNPCIYLFNPRKKRQWDSYTPLAKKILDTYYIATDEKQLRDYIEQVIFQSLDSKKEKRKCLLQSEFGSIGKAGDFICGYLEKELLD